MKQYFNKLVIPSVNVKSSQKVREANFKIGTFKREKTFEVNILK